MFLVWRRKTKVGSNRIIVLRRMFRVQTGIGSASRFLTGRLSIAFRRFFFNQRERVAHVAPFSRRVFEILMISTVPQSPSTMN